MNLQTNAHLDSVYGGYCVFAEVVSEESFATVDKIAEKIKGGAGTVTITSATLAS